MLSLNYSVKNVNTPAQYVPRTVYTLEIVHDHHAESPREWDCCTTFVGRNHRKMTIGDKTAEPLEAMVMALEEVGAISPSLYDYYCELMPVYFGEDDRAAILRKFNEHFVMRWVYMYDHGNVTFSTSPFSCQWDSGTAGIIFMSKKDIRKEYGVKYVTDKVKQRVLKLLDGDIETYSQWASGETYGFRVWEHLEDQSYEDGDEVDSCYGFYGYDYKTNGILEHVYDPIHNVVGV